MKSDFAPTVIVLSGADRHRYHPPIQPTGKAASRRIVRKFLTAHWRLLLAAAIVIGAPALAVKQIKNNDANTAKAEKQGNILVIPQATFRTK